jgi:hypothetical protein
VILTLTGLMLVDQADRSSGWRAFVRYVLLAGPILMPLGFFLSVVPPQAQEPNRLISLVPLGGLAVSVGIVALGIGLLGADTGSLRRRQECLSAPRSAAREP